jgi:DNA repair protein RadC
VNGTTLYTTDVNNPTGFRAATLDEIMAGARHALSIRIRKGTVLNSPKATADFLIARLAQREHEVFTLIYLDTRHRLIACQDVFRGTIEAHRSTRAKS